MQAKFCDLCGVMEDGLDIILRDPHIEGIDSMCENCYKHFEEFRSKVVKEANNKVDDYIKIHTTKNKELKKAILSQCLIKTK